MHDRYTTLYDATPTEKWQHKSNTFCGKNKNRDGGSGRGMQGGRFYVPLGFGRIEGAAGQQRCTVLLLPPPPPDFQTLRHP